MNNKNTILTRLGRETLLLTTILAITVIAVSGCVNKPQEEIVVVPEDNKQEESDQAGTAGTDKVVKEEEQEENISTSTDEEIDTFNWLTYRNEEYGFEVKYPEGWETYSYNLSDGKSIAFGTYESKPGGYIWGINIYNNISDMRGLIKKQGSQFTDRLEKREKIITNEVEGILVTVTTPSHPTWISKSIFITKNNKLEKMRNLNIFIIFSNSLINFST